MSLRKCLLKCRDETLVFYPKFKIYLVIIFHYVFASGHPIYIKTCFECQPVFENIWIQRSHPNVFFKEDAQKNFTKAPTMEFFYL